MSLTGQYQATTVINNLLTLGKFEWNYKSVHDWCLVYLLLNCSQMNVTGPYFNIASDNGLVLPGSKPLSEPTLIQIYVAIWYHQATMGYSVKYTVCTSIIWLNTTLHFFYKTVATGRTLIRYCTHNSHPKSRHQKQAMGCIFWELWRILYLI